MKLHIAFPFVRDERQWSRVFHAASAFNTVACALGTQRYCIRGFVKSITISTGCILTCAVDDHGAERWRASLPAASRPLAQKRAAIFPSLTQISFHTL